MSDVRLMLVEQVKRIADAMEHANTLAVERDDRMAQHFDKVEEHLKFIQQDTKDLRKLQLERDAENKALDEQREAEYQEDRKVNREAAIAAKKSHELSAEMNQNFIDRDKKFFSDK